MTDGRREDGQPAGGAAPAAAPGAPSAPVAAAGTDGAILLAAAAAISDPLFVKDAAGRWLYANPATLAAIGRSLAEAIGHTDREIYADPAIGEALMETDRRILRSGAAEVVEEAIDTPAGRRTFLSTKAPLRDAGGRIVGIVGSARDITEPKRAAEALGRVNRALLLVTRCHEALVRATSEEALFAEVCRIMIETGRYRMAWIGIAEEDARRTVRPVASAGGGTDYLARADIVWADSARGRGPAGVALRERRPVVGVDFATDPVLAPWSAGALERGLRFATSLPLLHEGRRLGAITMYAEEARIFDDEEVQLLQRLADDIAFGVVILRRRAEQGATERALREREQTFRDIFLTSPDSMTVTRLEDGTYAAVNDGFFRLFGWSEPEIVGRSALDLGIWDSPADRAAMIERLRVDGVVENFETRFRTRDGRAFPALVSARVISFGEAPRLLAIARDVSALRRAEAERERLDRELHQAQKLESVGRLAGGVAHDFNNLLTVVLSAAEVLAEDAAAGLPASEADVAAIRGAGERARDLTRQLLAVARRQVVAPVVADLRPVLAEAEGLLRRVIGEDVELALEAPAALWPVLCDPGQIDQILLNLAANARDAMPGGGRLAVTARNVELDAGGARGRPEARAGAWVELAVSDTGTGMSAEVRRHLFEPFFTTKPRGAGTGLGLATVYGLVRQMGGSISVESEEGSGSRFEILLPRAEGEPSPGRLAPGTGPRAAGGPETVLLVEDDPGVRETGARALAGAGYRLLVAASATEAAEAAARLAGALDLLVTDVILPDRPGPVLAEELARARPGLRILLVSGYAGDLLAGRGLLGGAVDLLPKPFTGAELLARVRAALDRPT